MNELVRKESNKELIKDCINKLNHLNGMSWEEINKKYNTDYSDDHLRKLSYGFKIYADTLSDEDNLINDEILEIKKQKVQLSDLRVEVNKKARELARTENVINLIKQEIKNLSIEKPLINNYHITMPYSGKDGILMFSDWHYSLKINNSVNKYNEDICNKRINLIIDKAIHFGKENNIDKLHIICLGDMISGEIHNTVKLSNQESVAKQIVKVSELLCESIKKLSNYFYCTISIIQGNHDAVDSKKTDRLNRNNYTDLIKEIVKIRLENLSNVVILDNSINDGEIATLKVKNLKVACCHGDKIDRLKIKSQLEMATKSKIDLILHGHIHNPQMYSIFDTDVYINGSLCGTDEYAMNNKLYSVPSQTMLIIDDNGVKSSSILKI